MSAADLSLDLIVVVVCLVVAGCLFTLVSGSSLTNFYYDLITL